MKLADVQPEEVSWLWRPYIPLGKVSLLEGDPECGKSYLSLLLAAYVTTGRGLPDYGTSPTPDGPPRNVLLLAGEDGTADTIVPRLVKTGGDKNRVFQLSGVIQHRDGKDIELGVTLDDIAHIEEALKEFRPLLVIVDPFQSFLGSHVDMHRANEIRPVLDGLGKLAAKYECAFLLLRHLKKDTAGGANYRGLGSIDIYAAARSVLLAGKNPSPPKVNELFDEKTRLVFAQTKSSLAKKGPSIAYAIDGSGVRLEGPENVTADDILRVTPKYTETDRQGVDEWLTAQLKDGPKPARDVKHDGGANGFSARQLDSACQRLGVIRKPAGFGSGWQWSLCGLEATEPTTEKPAA